VAEWAVENYLAFFCAASYRKHPTFNKLQAFLITFGGDNSPLELNVDKGTLNKARSTMMACAHSKSNPPRNALDDIDRTTRVNLVDTFSRFRLAWKPSVLGGSWKKSSQGKELKKKKLSNENIKNGLGYLRWGGYPVNHFGLSGIVG